jgi:hypothetical protein
MEKCLRLSNLAAAAVPPHHVWSLLPNKSLFLFLNESAIRLLLFLPFIAVLILIITTVLTTEASSALVVRRYGSLLLMMLPLESSLAAGAFSQLDLPHSHAYQAELDVFIRLVFDAFIALLLLLVIIIWQGSQIVAFTSTGFREHSGVQIECYASLSAGGAVGDVSRGV